MLKKTMERGLESLEKNGFLGSVRKIPKKIRDLQTRELPYEKWRRRHLPTRRELKEELGHVFPVMPVFTVLICKQGMADGSRPDLCAGTDFSGRREVLLYEGGRDSLKSILAQARGEYIVLSEWNETFPEDAIYWFTAAINAHPEAALIYADEDCVSKDGKHYYEPRFKPDLSPYYLLSTNYIGHPLLFRRDVLEALLEEAGAGVPQRDLEYALLLLALQTCKKRIVHIPKVLVHRISAGEAVDQEDHGPGEADLIRQYYEKAGHPAVIEASPYKGIWYTRFIRPRDPLVSVIIPTKDHVPDLKRCIGSIEQKTTYRNYEYILIENNSTDPGTFLFYKELKEKNSRVRLIEYKGDFNYSAINNLGASRASGEYLLFLNNDTEVISPSWMEDMLGYAMLPGVGAVGARLYYPDGTIQHAGVVLGFGEVAGHCFVQQKQGAEGTCRRIVTPQNYSAVTAACMMVPREIFMKAGGFFEGLAVAFNDVDLCLTLGKMGLDIIYDPRAELYHYESLTRGYEDTPEKQKRFAGEIRQIRERWPGKFDGNDPFYNPNLTRISQDFSLKRKSEEADI